MTETSLPGSGAPRGVLLMTYGSPDSPADVPRYLAAVRGGRAAEPELVTEFTRRYEVIGGSPLVARTIEQAAALEARLGGDWRVRAAMRFSEPSLEAALRGVVAEGVEEVVAIVLSPQYSPLLMGGYERDLRAAIAAIGDPAPAVHVAGPWYREPGFVHAMADRVREGLARAGALGDAAASTTAATRGHAAAPTPVLLTAHSLPRRVAEREPGYLDQLEESARLIAAAADLRDGQWTFCWQSAGHEPGEWMRPDFADLMPTLRADGHDRVVVAPIQFLSDHLEVLYDVDVGAREQAESAGLVFARIRSLNDAPGLIEALAAAVRTTIESERPLDRSVA
ncbi:MAG: ferrochelatase [Candidatus Limnocylindria bacterium]